MKPGCRCVELYRHEGVRALLGDVWHPGGLGLTRELGGRLGLKPSDVVLDVASGRGAGSGHLAETFGCRVVGADAGDAPPNVRAWAERLPFCAGIFDAAVIECALSTFEDQARCLSEVYRVLRPGGRLGVSDMIVRDRLPEGFAGSLSELACLSRARDETGYRRALTDAGFREVDVSDRPDALGELVRRIGTRLFAADLLTKLKGIEIEAATARKLLAQAADLVDRGVLSYAILTARRPA